MKLKLSLFAIILIAITSCQLSFFPSKSDKAITQVENAATAVDNFYQDIIGSTDKSYTSFQAGYQVINEQLSDILITDSTRKSAGVILIIARDIQKRFATYEAEHKAAGTINSAQALTYKDYMHAVFETLQNAENNFK